MTDKLDVEAHSGPCDRLGICELCTLRLELRAKDEAIAREHELYLTAHRDNMKAATRLMAKDEEIKGLLEKVAELEGCKELGLASHWKSRAAALEKERDELRAALSGRTVSCSNCNALQAQLAQAVKAFEMVEFLARGGDGDAVRDVAKKFIAALRQSVPASHEAGEGRP